MPSPLDSRLLSACYQGDSEEVVRLLDAGADLNAESHPHRETPLISAFRSRSFDVASLLLDRGARVTSSDISGWTTLHWATSNGAPPSMIKTLLDRGAEVNAKSNGGSTPLDCAAQCGNGSRFEPEEPEPGRYGKIIKLLLEWGASCGAAALVSASRAGNEEVVKLLLGAGARVNATTYQNTTALLAAARMGSPATVRLLLEHGADVNAQDSDRKSPLIWASESGSTETVRILLDRGARINRKDYLGGTALYWAARRQDNETTELLVDRGADPNLGKIHGWTALHSAVEHQNEAMARLLINHGADIHARADVERKSPFEMAEEKQLESLSQYMLENSVPVEQINQKLDAPAKEMNRNTSGAKPNETGRQCFIATATYGTPYAPEVILLKEFRDNILCRSFLGRICVRAYEKISPPLSDMISQSRIARKLIRLGIVGPALSFAHYLLQNPSQDVQK